MAALTVGHSGFPRTIVNALGMPSPNLLQSLSFRNDAGFQTLKRIKYDHFFRPFRCGLKRNGPSTRRFLADLISSSTVPRSQGQNH